MSEIPTKLNIIFTGEFTYPKGMAGTKRVQHFMDYLSVENTVRVFLFRQKGNAGNDLKIEGTKDKVFYRVIGSNLGLSYKIPAAIFLGFKTLWKWKQKRSKNIFYVYNGITIEYILFVLFAKIIGYKIVVEYVEDYRHTLGTIHSGLAFKNKTNVFFERFLPWLAKGVIVISTHLYRKYENLQKKVHLIHIPISSYVSEELFIKTAFSSPVKIVYSGSFGAKDGLDTLIDGFNEFSQKYTNCQLLLSGKTRYQQQIEEYCKNPKIQYVGFIPDEEFDSFLAKADILCMTRNKMQFANAGFPFKLGEYLATGKPVIATKVSDVELYLENLQDAVLIEPERPDQIVEALNLLTGNPEKAFEIGRNGRKKCMEHFSPAKNGKRLADFLISI